MFVLTGAGRGFCSGDDLKEVDHDNQTPKSVRAHITAIQEITHLMLGCDKPIVGAIHGYAVGGGFEWLLNCDIVVAAEQLTAFFPEFDWGYYVTGGVTHLLPQAIGYQRSMELMLLGERQSAADLKALGLVNFVVSQEQMEAKAFEVAEKIASKARFSVARLKRMLDRGSRRPAVACRRPRARSDDRVFPSTRGHRTRRKIHHEKEELIAEDCDYYDSGASHFLTSASLISLRADHRAGLTDRPVSPWRRPRRRRA